VKCQNRNKSENFIPKIRLSTLGIKFQSQLRGLVMKETPSYQWKINFHIENVKLDKDWSKNGLHLVSRVEKRLGLSDKNDIFGFCRINTKGDNQIEAEAKAGEIIDGVIASCSIITGMERLQVGYIVPPEVENEKELKEMGLPVSRSIGPVTLYASGAHGGVDDATKMQYLALNLFDEAEAKQVLTDMTKVISKLTSAKGCYLSESQKTDFADELEQSLNKRSYRSALYYAIRCIYSIRKTLFHGDRDIMEAEKEIVENVNPLLKQIVRRSMLKCLVGKI
jgi:hypothetical protein